MPRAILIIGALFALVSCSSANVRSSLNPNTTKPNPRIGIVSDNLLADAIGNELVRYGFTVIERSRLQAILDELKLSLSGILKEGDMRRVGEILNVDALMFVTVKTEPDFPSKIGSATIKMVDAQTGTLIGGVTYQNGRGGAPGSPADAGMKESLPESAERIGKEIAIGFGKAKGGFF